MVVDKLENLQSYKWDMQLLDNPGFKSIHLSFNFLICKIEMSRMLSSKSI